MNNRVLILCLTVLGVFAVGAGLVIGNSPDGGAAASRSIGLIITGLGPIITTLVLVSRQDAVKATAEKTQENTEKILNGTMDEKIKRNVHEVLDERAKQAGK